MEYLKLECKYYFYYYRITIILLFKLFFTHKFFNELINYQVFVYSYCFFNELLILSHCVNDI